MNNYCKINTELMDKLIKGLGIEYPEKNEAQLRELANSQLNFMIKRRNETGRTLVKQTDIRGELQKTANSYMENPKNMLDKTKTEKLYKSVFGGLNDSLFSSKFSGNAADDLESWSKNGNVIELAKRVGFDLSVKESKESPIEKARAESNVGVQGSWEPTITTEEKVVSIAAAFGIDTSEGDSVLNTMNLAKNKVNYEKVMEQKEVSDLIENKVDPAEVIVDLNKPKKMILSRSLKESIEPNSVIEFKNISKDYDTFKELLSEEIIKPESKAGEFVMESEETFNEYVNGLKESMGEDGLEKTISTLFKLSPEYEGTRYSTDDVYESLQSNATSGIDSTMDATANASIEKEKLLAERKANSKYVTHNKVIKYIMNKRGEAVYDSEGNFTKMINDSYDSDEEVSISQYIDQHYDEYTDIEGNTYYKDSSNGKVITNDDFVNLVENVYLSSANNLIVTPDVKPLSVDNIDIIKDLPSEIGEKVLAASMGKRTGDIKEKQWELTKSMSDLHLNMTLIDNATAKDGTPIDTKAVEQIYKDYLNDAVEEGHTDMRVSAGMLSQGAGEEFDTTNPANFQSLMVNMKDKGGNVDFVIDVSEKELRSKQDAIFKNFKKGKRTYLTTDFASKTISYNVVTHAEVIEGHEKSHQQINDKAYESFSKAFDKTPEAIELTYGEKWNQLRALKESKYKEFVKANPKELLEPGVKQKTKDTYVVHSKVLFTHNVSADVTNYRYSEIDNYFKRKVEEEYMSKKDFASKSLQAKIAYTKKQLEASFQRKTRVQQELADIHRSLDKNTTELLKENAPELLGENRMYIPKKGKEAESAIAEKKLKSFMTKSRLGKGEVRYLSKADNNIINAKYGTWKDVTVESTENGKLFTLMNNKVKATGKPAMFRVWLDKFTKDGSQQISIQSEGNGAGKTAKKFLTEGEEGYDTLVALHDHNGKNTIRKNADIAAIKTGIKYINKNFANEIKSTIYNFATKGKKDLSAASEIVKDVVDNKLLSLHGQASQEYIANTKQNAHDIIDAVYNHPNIQTIEEANEVLQKVSIQVTNTPNSLHKIDRPDIKEEALLIADAIAFHKNTFTEELTNSLKAIGEGNSFAAQKDRPFDYEWSLRQIGKGYDKIDSITDKIDTIEQSIKDIKDESIELTAKKKESLKANDIKTASSIDYQIKSNELKVKSLQNEYDKHNNEYIKLKTDIMTAFATGTDARSKLALRMFKQRVEDGVWQPGTKAYKPLYEKVTTVDADGKEVTKTQYVGEEKIFDTSGFKKEESVIEKKYADDFEEAEAPEAGVDTDTLTTREGKIPTRLSELKADDMSEFSRIIREIDHLTKSKLGFNDIEDFDYVDPEQYKKRLDVNEASGVLSFNRFPETFEMLHTVFNMELPRIKQAQLISAEQKSTLDMMDAEPSVRQSEDTSGNKGYKC